MSSKQSNGGQGSKSNSSSGNEYKSNYSYAKSYGGMKNFMESYGLRHYNDDDVQEAHRIIDGFRQADNEAGQRGSSSSKK